VKFHFTIDVDWIPGSDVGLASLLALCDRHQLRATLFVAGKFAEAYPGILRRALQDGHEIGSHGWKHGLDDKENFRTCPYEAQRQWIQWSTSAIEDACGLRPVMFRAPNLWITEATLQLLLENGFKLDSSIPARRFDFGYGQCNYTRYFAAPQEPYYPSERHFGRRGNVPLLEVAPSAYRCIPINMSALRMFGFRTVAWATRRLSKKTQDLVFYSHPAEFVAIEEQEVPDSDPRRYRRGIGPQNLPLVERYVKYVLDLGYRPSLFSEDLRENYPPDHRH
jgi:peptidoglycan/xylan/chitin deacetylase (PgdA/CDA1 family)